jgi:hypothetical protein
MNNLNPIDLRDAQARFKHSSRSTSRRIWIWVFSALIVAVMSAWLIFLGWGLIEILRAAERFLAALI